MMKLYRIYLDDNFIGTTNFEFSDVSMGIVYGKIKFDGISDPFTFLKNYYLKKNAVFEFDDESKFLDSMVQNFIKVNNEDGNILEGWGSFITGVEDDFEITLGGIPSKLMEKEFIHHWNNI